MSTTSLVDADLEGVRTSFAFKGERDYVHGPTLFEAFRLAALQRSGKTRAAVSVRRFAVHQTVVNDGAIRSFDADEIAAKLPGKDALADLSCTIDGRPFMVGFYEDEPTPVERRQPSLEKSFVGEVRLTDAFTGSAALQNLQSHEDLIQAVAEANKQIDLLTIAEVAPDLEPKFKFVTCQRIELPADLTSTEGLVTVTHAGMQEIDGYRYILNRLNVTLDDTVTQPTICFASCDLQGLDFLQAGGS